MLKCLCNLHHPLIFSPIALKVSVNLENSEVDWLVPVLTFYVDILQSVVESLIVVSSELDVPVFKRNSTPFWALSLGSSQSDWHVYTYNERRWWNLQEKESFVIFELYRKEYKIGKNPSRVMWFSVFSGEAN